MSQVLHQRSERHGTQTGRTQAFTQERDAEKEMTAKEFLRQYEHAQYRADMCKQEYEIEALKIDAIGSTLAGDGMPHGNGVSRKTEDKAIRLAEKAKVWREAELKAIEKRQEVFGVIEQVGGIEGKILYDRYILSMTWERLAEDCDRSEKWCRTELHSRALQIVKEILGTSL